MELHEFLDSDFFTGLEMFLVVIFCAIIQRFLIHQVVRSTNAASKKRTSQFQKIDFWTQNKNKMAPDAFNVRGSWAIKEGKKKVQQNQAMPNINMLNQLIGMVSNFAPMLIANFLLSGRKALTLPFDVPSVLRKFLQNGLPPNEESDPRVVTVFGLNFFLGMCSEVFALLIPVIHPISKVYGPKDLLQIPADDFVVAEHQWELENAEKDLVALIDQKLKKSQ